MQLICETLFPPRTSVTITFLTYSSYTSQSIAVVTTAIFIPVYLFIVWVLRGSLFTQFLSMAMSWTHYFTR